MGFAVDIWRLRRERRATVRLAPDENAAVVVFLGSLPAVVFSTGRFAVFGAPLVASEVARGLIALLRGYRMQRRGRRQIK